LFQHFPAIVNVCVAGYVLLGEWGAPDDKMAHEYTPTFGQKGFDEMCAISHPGQLDEERSRQSWDPSHNEKR
jgi:2-keto-4-pentenoate hydratase/2-oxohepta-3-ene-1,7-dioic acid hydratase in catechol pathway